MVTTYGIIRRNCGGSRESPGVSCSRRGIACANPNTNATTKRRFGSQFGFGGNHFRIGFGRTDLPVALDRLEAFAERTLR